MKVAVGSFRGEARERNFCQARADISRFIQMRAAADGARGGGRGAAGGTKKPGVCGNEGEAPLTKNVARQRAEAFDCFSSGKARSFAISRRKEE